MKYVITALSLALSTFLPITAEAQVASPNQNVWQSMREVVFDNPELPSTASQEDRNLVQEIWGSELAARRTDERGPFPGYVLIGHVHQGPKQIVFSMYTTAGSDHCDPAANGSGVTDIFVECRMRVTTRPYTGLHKAELPSYCMIYAASETNSRVEYRYDTATQTLHFRTIQFGKGVPVCTRALKLG